MKSASVLLPAALLVACTTSAPPAPPVAGPAAPPPIAITGPETPSAFTRAEHDKVRTERPFSDTRDFDFAQRGFIATRKDPLITNAAGQPVWSLSAFDFLKAADSATVNPSLWRQAQLMAKHGLFQVSDRIWQVRGFDLANITFVKGDKGWIIIDTLGSNETAKAALDLVTELFLIWLLAPLLFQILGAQLHFDCAVLYLTGKINL